MGGMTLETKYVHLRASRGGRRADGRLAGFLGARLGRWHVFFVAMLRRVKPPSDGPR